MGQTKVQKYILVQKIFLFRFIELYHAGECLFSFFVEIAPSCFRFHIVVNCTCSLLFFSIFHFLLTTFVRRPFSAKTIQGFRQLICIINRLHKRATSKRKQNKWKNEQDGRGIQIPSSNKPGYLASWEMRLFRIVWLCGKHIFKSKNLFEIELTLCQKTHTHQPFVKINAHL